MKKVGLVTLVVLLLSPYCYGQRSLIGVKFNPQISWLSATGEGAKSAGSLLGVNFGLALDNAITDNYYLCTGISLTNTGGLMSYSDSALFRLNNSGQRDLHSEELKFKLMYMHVPLGLKFKTAPRGNHRFYANVGLDALIRLRAALISEEERSVRHNITSEIEPFNLAYHFGGGIELFLPGETVIQTGLSFSQGFLDTTKVIDNQIHQNSVSLCIGLFF